MELRTLGRTGLKVSALGLGTSEIGYESVTQRQINELVNAALDAGLNVIDTAACYGDAEEMIGRAAGHRRADYHILTKCGHAAGIRLPDWSPELIERSIERSLKRLRTDHLDLVQFHSCSIEVLEREAVVAALVRARDAGKTRFIGYSGDGEAARRAVRSGIFDTLQISVSIADQEAIDGAIAEARERHLGVIAKRPIANAAWLLEPGRGGIDWYYRTYRERLEKLGYGFLFEGPKSAVATALRFTLSVPGVHTAIVGTTRPRRWNQNAELIAPGRLKPTQYDAIRARWRAVADASWVGQR
jgi:aryl-alcohol dehydrogenase-like predicted oxidoreductase